MVSLCIFTVFYCGTGLLYDSRSPKIRGDLHGLLPCPKSAGDASPTPFEWIAYATDKYDKITIPEDIKETTCYEPRYDRATLVRSLGLSVTL